ncbi:MAG: virulence protein [Magnetococcales bacterium]|nr:virulence protein [Magnetococcales bacterium]NGZ25442.1 virulence protein [Magnetococcales bacterium]
MSEIGNNDILIYQSEDGTAMTEVRLEAGTVWLRQEQMGQLCGRERSVITRHVGNVFTEGELAVESNVQILHIAGSDKPEKSVKIISAPALLFFLRMGEGTRCDVLRVGCQGQEIYCLGGRRLTEGGPIMPV